MQEDQRFLTLPITGNWLKKKLLSELCPGLKIQNSVVEYFRTSVCIIGGDWRALLSALHAREMHSWVNTALLSGLSLEMSCSTSMSSLPLSLRQGHGGEAKKRTWHQNDSTVCLSLNMHKWIIGESKCMHGSIKHFGEHLRWKPVLRLFIFSSVDEVSKAWKKYMLYE